MRTPIWTIKIQIFIVFTVLFISLCSSNVTADGADAELHNVEVLASPSSQGLGGLIIIDAAAYFYGGCCYHLFANDVTANLTVPEGLDIIDGPSPEIYEEVDAQPGGAATVVHFKWTLKGISTGIYNVTATILTKNCGSVENKAHIEIVEGCIISSPLKYPSKPSVNKKNIFQVSASTSLEGRNVMEVTMFYLVGENVERMEAKNDTLYMDDEEIEGKKLVLSQDPTDEEKWSCKFDLNNEGNLLFWFVAKDNVGENTTSSVFSEQVVDKEKDNYISSLMFWSAIIIAIIGILLIFTVQDIFMKRRETRKGVMIPMKREDENKKDRLLKRMVIYVLLFLSFLLIIFALINGVFSDIIELAMG